MTTPPPRGASMLPSGPPTPPAGPPPAPSAPPPGPSTPPVIIRRDGPGMLVRFVWWLVIGWWLSWWTIVIAWLALITIVGFPLGIWLINRLPTVLTLRPRTRVWTLGLDAEGRTVVVAAARAQTAWWIRGLWFLVVGWWASAVWMAVAWVVSVTVIGLPLALLMFNRTPFVASLYRY